MKNKLYILLVIFSITFVNNVLSQCYTVLNIKGEVKFKNTGRKISKMEEICPNDLLVFGSANDCILVCGSDRGSYKLKPQFTEKTSEFIAYVKSLFKTEAGSGSTRGSGNLLNEFNDDYFVIDSLNIAVNRDYFVLDNNQYFFFRYVFNGETINKIIPMSGDTMSINKSVFEVNNHNIPQEEIDFVKLYYCDEKGKEMLISRFPLRFLSKTELEVASRDLYEILIISDISDTEIMIEIYNYLYELYGKFNGAAFTKWFKNTYSE